VRPEHVVLFCGARHLLNEQILSVASWQEFLVHVQPIQGSRALLPDEISRCPPPPDLRRQLLRLAKETVIDTLTCHRYFTHNDYDVAKTLIDLKAAT
jgi:hypothetical protein